MLDFSECVTTESKSSQIFKNLKVGEIFALTDSLDCGEVSLNTQYVYIKTSESYGIELNEDNLDCLGQTFNAHEAVTRVKLVVSSVNII